MSTKLNLMDLKQYDLDKYEEWDIWKLFPQHRWLFNKLELSIRLGYSCGPTPMPVSKTTEYVIRPIYNLSGMGAGAYIKTLEKDKIYDFPPSLFWCERFIGDHLSVNYVWQQDKFCEVQTTLADTNYNNLSRFNKWALVYNRNIKLPRWLDDLKDVKYINIEFIDNKIIEIHLRWGIDFPEGATEIVPVWSTDDPDKIDNYKSIGYNFVKDYMDAEKNLLDPRLGFLYK